MNKKLIMISGVLLVLVLIAGCQDFSSYLVGDNKSYSELNEEEKYSDLDKVIEDIESEDVEIDVDDMENKTAEEILKELRDDEEKTEDEETKEKTEDEETEEASVIIRVKENETISLKPEAIDEDDDEITYTFTEPLDANGRWATDYGDAGTYYSTVTASDGELKTTQKIKLIVERVNIAPVIKGPDTITTEEGETLELNLDISDPNDDGVEVSISDPVGDDMEWDIGYTDHGDYEVTVKASDGEKTTVKKISLAVKRKNMPPVISELEDIEIKEGETIKIEPIVTDPNEDPVDVEISDPLGDDGEWTPDFTEHGTYTVTVKASDGEATATKSFKLTVENVNKAPRIVDIIQG